MIDKDIYVDVDGTLTRECLVADGKGEGVRTHVEEFLDFLVTNFKNVYWLTANRSFTQHYLPSIGREDLQEKIKFKEWYTSKYDVLDTSRAFYFFDDEIEYDTWQEFGFLLDSIPEWKKGETMLRFDFTKHILYYVRADAPMDYLELVIKDIKKRERLN